MENLQSDKPVMCEKGCGFFGSGTTMNMCSKCYKEHCLLTGAVQIVKQVERVKNEGKLEVNQVKEVKVDARDEVNNEVKVKLEVKNEVKEAAKKITNRCHVCQKKLGLVQQTAPCRCGEYLCTAHKFSSNHNCTFDYRAMGREKITMANPVIKAEKMKKI